MFVSIDGRAEELWQGVDAYDSHLKCRFNLRVVHGQLNCLVCMNESDAFRLQHGRKVSIFDYHRRFLSLSHEFRGDKESFQKGKRVRKGPPKQKLGADIVKMLDKLKESCNGGFEGYDEKHNLTHKSCL
jgi:hypothetical protein